MLTRLDITPTSRLCRAVFCAPSSIGRAVDSKSTGWRFESSGARRVRPGHSKLCLLVVERSATLTLGSLVTLQVHERERIGLFISLARGKSSSQLNARISSGAVELVQSHTWHCLRGESRARAVYTVAINASVRGKRSHAGPNPAIAASDPRQSAPNTHRGIWAG